jgi:protoporphyrinogen oxidase
MRGRAASDAPDIVVVGAGPAGLGAGLALGEAAIVLERGADVGGLCRTIELGGAIFDLGGHSFHTPHPAIRDLIFRATPMEEQRRQAWCFVAGEWIPYPFQKNVAKLKDEAVRAVCLAGLERAGDGSQAANFDRYIDERFGAGVAGHFMRPYNEKLWGADLSRLATEWTAERVASPSAAAERFPFEGGRRAPLQGDTTIGYPARGGFGEIYRALAGQLPRLTFGQTVVRIDPARRALITARGDALAWKQLVSTLPLPALLTLLPDVPAAIRDAVARLEVLPVNLVMVALAGRLDTDMQRVYCPDPEIAGHKFVLNHNSSTYLRERPHHGIQVEISGSRKETDEELTRLAIRDLQALELLRGRDEIAATQVVRLPFGYPVPTHARAGIVDEATAWLESQGIWTVGRFGQWAYINSDEALYRGLRLGARLAGNGDAAPALVAPPQ